MDKLDFLDGSQEPSGEAVTETPAVEAVAEAPVVEEAQETPEQIATRERDERGRFKAKEADEPVMVPIKALHETRDKVNALEARIQQLTQSQQQPQQAPDIFEDPEGYQSNLNQSVDFKVQNVLLNLSEEMVTERVGTDVVEAAKQWGDQAFRANPSLFQQFISQRNPYGFLVQEYQKQTALTKLGDPKEIDAFLAWKAAQAQVQQQPAETPIQQPTPTQSIASAPSAGGMQQIATGPGVAFSETIK
jgi:hypothetical protein